MADTWTWATVTQASPLRIKVDGDTSALDATTDNLVGSLAVDDRVRVHLHADGIIVTGLQGGAGGGTPEATAATADTLALRDGDGQLKAADGVADDDVATVAQLPNPNLLINSNFVVNQEGTATGATIDANAYILDGWKCTSSGSRAFSWADVGGVRTLTFGNASFTVEARQIVEAVNLPAGEYTASTEATDCYLRVYDAAGSMLVNMAAPGAGTFAADGTQNYSVAVITASGQTASVSWVKFERGTVATPYSPPTYEDNLRTCMRHYYRLTGFIGLFAAYSTTRFFCGMNFPVSMRATPTSVASSATGIGLTGSGGAATSTAILFSRATRDRLRIEVSGGSFPAGSAGWLDIAAGQWLAFDARL